jgi:peptidase M28-like protein
VRTKVFCALLALAVPVPRVAQAQTSPFLPDGLHRDLVNEISGDRAFENDRWLTHYHRTGGSRDFFAAAEWIQKAGAGAGLQDVRLVRQQYKGQSWSCLGGEAWLVGPEPVRLASYGEVAVSIADHSRTTHATAELVDVGAGIADADYAGRTVAGRIVLASGPVAAAHREAVWKRGALGVLSHATNRPDAADAPDQVAWGRLPFDARDVEGVKDGTPSTFAVMISPRRGRWLQKRLAAAGAPLSVRIDVEAAFLPRAEQAYVEAWIRGTEVRDQQIVLTAHIQEEMTSANDDGSGCANLIEIGRALTRLVAEGKVPRPRRDIRFWWVNEFASEEQFFRENPGEPARMLLNVNQDMVGARQSMGSRVQYASRLPWSLPHALEDVMESVLLMVRDGNTSLLTTRGTAHPQPFTREITAVKGSREPYHARMVPYHGSTDHHAFTPAPIGVPATTLTNWPDEFIHSTGDDLDQVDATQLERNAVVVAAVTLYFAGLTDADAPALAAYVASRGAGRIAADLATGIAHVAEAAPGDRPAAFHAARNLLRHSYRRELAALGSVPRMAPRSRAGEIAARWSAERDGRMGRDLSALDEAWTAITATPVPDLARTPEEEEMAALVYARTKDIGAYRDAMERVKAVDGLHSILQFEVYNFADGRRSALEVYDAVAAEALSAGRWYYGKVTPAAVREALERATKAGAFTVSRKAG